MLGEFEANKGNPLYSDGKMLNSTKAYFELEHLHPYSNGNTRAFGQIMFCMSLARQGEDIAAYYDPRASDGASPEESLPFTQEEQQRVR